MPKPGCLALIGRLAGQGIVGSIGSGAAETVEDGVRMSSSETVKVPEPASPEPAGPVRNAAVLPYIVAATFFMEYLDSTIIATALPQMARSFGVEPNAVSVGMSAYMLTLAVFIPISGWIADRLGSRTVLAARLSSSPSPL